MTESNNCLQKLKGYVGLAMRAGAVVFGVDNIILTHSRLAIYDKTLSANSQNKLKNYCEKIGLKCLETSDLEQICMRPNCKAIAIKDANLAKMITINITTSSIQGE